MTTAGRTGTASLVPPPNAHDSTAVFEVLTKASMIYGSHRFTCDDGFYKIPNFCIGFRGDGSCFGFRGIFAQGNEFNLTKDEYVVWVPRTTINLVRAIDPLLPTTNLQYANLKPIEDRPTPEEKEAMIRELKELKVMMAERTEQWRKRIEELERWVA